MSCALWHWSCVGRGKSGKGDEFACCDQFEYFFWDSADAGVFCSLFTCGRALADSFLTFFACCSDLIVVVFETC